MAKGVLSGYQMEVVVSQRYFWISVYQTSVELPIKYQYMRNTCALGTPSRVLARDDISLLKAGIRGYVFVTRELPGTRCQIPGDIPRELFQNAFLLNLN